MGLTKDEAFAAVFSDPFGGGTIRPYDYLAAAGYNQWGFVTAYHEPDPHHVVGCLAIGQEIGVQGWAGSFESGPIGRTYWYQGIPDIETPGLGSGDAGPAENAYWDKAGVVGWSPQFTGVAGTTTSLLRPGVYGQSGDAQGLPEGANAGVFGASSQAVGVRGWSTVNIGVAGDSDTSSGVFGASQSEYGVVGKTGGYPFGPHVADPNNPGTGDELWPNLAADEQGFVTAGVWGTAADAVGVAGSSLNASGVLGQSGRAPAFDPKMNYTGGVVGTSRGAAGVVGVSQNSYGVIATSQNIGLLATSENGIGVFATSQSGDGVFATSANGAGVAAGSQTEAGVFALSATNSGVTGMSGTLGPGVPNTIDSVAGVMGTSGEHLGVLGTSVNEAGVAGYSKNVVGVYGETGAVGSNAYAGYFRGNLFVTGQIFAGTKDAIVPFSDGSHRLMHCMESPEHWFEDFGGARLKRGRAVVKLDADFAKTIKTGDYRVFLTPEGNCGGLYIKSKRGGGFEVRELQGGMSNVAFSYRIVGRRRDIKRHKRFARIDITPPMPIAKSRALGHTAARARAFARKLRAAMQKHAVALRAKPARGRKVRSRRQRKARA